MQTVEPPPPHLPIDRVLAEAKRDELAAPNHPMLQPHELLDRTIQLGLRQFSAHIADK